MVNPRTSEAPEAKAEREGDVQVVPREYAGKWVAWSSDGRRIVAVGESFDDCERAAVAAGFAANWVAIGKIPVLRGVGGGVRRTRSV